MPAADTFAAGGADVNVPTFASATLTPGSYGALTLGTSPFGSATLTLTGGDYFFTGITSEGAFNTLNLDLTSGPVRIFVTGDVDLGTAFTTEVNGGPAGGADPGLAAGDLLETLGNFNGSGFFTSDLFFGTIFAPDGSITTGFQTNVIGSLVGETIAAGSTNVTGVPYAGFAPSAVPEPSTLALAGLGALGLLGYGWRRKPAAA
jgi:hypothetical protein